VTAPTYEAPVALARPRGTWMRWLLIGIVAAYVGVLILAPIAALVAGAFAHGIAPILATLADPGAQAAFALTLQIAVITVAVNGLFGTIVAWVLARHQFRGRRLVNGLIDLPFAVSPVVAGYMLILLFGRLGPLAALEDALNVQVVFAVPGMVLATIFVTLPFMIRELTPVIAALDREQEHAAASLGARRWQTFWLVTLPALRWGMFYGLALTFARALGEFGAVLVVGGDIQGVTETAPLYIFRALDNRNYVAAYTAALILGLAALAVVVGIERLRKRG
jgi:sulfate/thiosulfate transport system permease protein